MSLSTADQAEMLVRMGFGARAQPASKQYPSVPRPPPGYGQHTGVEAVAYVQNRYIQLSATGTTLIAMTKASGKPLPCELLNAYVTEVKNYLATSQQIIDQLANMGIELRQALLRGGKTVPDANAPGGVKSLKLVVPLRPPLGGWTQQGKCRPGTPMLTDSFGDPALGAVTILTIIYAVVVATGAILVVRELKDIAVVWKEPQKPSIDPDCVEKLRVSYGYPKEGMSERQRHTLFKQCNVPHDEWSALGIVGLVAAVTLVVGGGTWFYFKALPKLRARRARREEEQEEASGLETEAQEKLKRARKLRRGRGRTAKEEPMEYYSQEVSPGFSGATLDCPCAL